MSSPSTCWPNGQRGQLRLRRAIIANDRGFHALTEVERKGISPTIKEAVLRGGALIERGVATSIAKPPTLVGVTFAESIIRNALLKSNQEVEAELSKFGFAGKWFLNPDKIGPDAYKDCANLLSFLVKIEKVKAQIEAEDRENSKRSVADQLDL